MRIIAGIYLAFVSIPSKSKSGLYKDFPKRGYLLSPNTNQDKGREAVRTLSLARIPPKKYHRFQRPHPANNRGGKRQQKQMCMNLFFNFYEFR